MLAKRTLLAKRVLPGQTKMLPIPNKVAGVWQALSTRSCLKPRMRPSTQVYAAAATGKPKTRPKDAAKTPITMHPLVCYYHIRN